MRCGLKDHRRSPTACHKRICSSIRAAEPASTGPVSGLSSVHPRLEGAGHSAGRRRLLRQPQYWQNFCRQRQGLPQRGSNGERENCERTARQRGEVTGALLDDDTVLRPGSHSTRLLRLVNRKFPGAWHASIRACAPCLPNASPSRSATALDDRLPGLSAVIWPAPRTW